LRESSHQLGDQIVPQRTLPFQYEIAKGPSGLTALAGLPVYLDLMAVSGLRRSIERHVHARTGGQGWTDAQMATPEP
jgi:hypothetical protein